MGMPALAMMALACALCSHWIASIGALHRSGLVTAKSSLVLCSCGAVCRLSTIFWRYGAYSLGGPDWPGSHGEGFLRASCADPN